MAKSPDVYEAFGKRLRELRTERALSQASLAERAELTTEFVGRLERAESGPSLETIQALARALSVEPKALFEFSSSMRGPTLDPILLRLADLARHATVDERKLLVRLAEAVLHSRKSRR